MTLTIEEANKRIAGGDAFWVEPYNDGNNYPVNEFVFDMGGVMADIDDALVYTATARLMGANDEAADIEITF